jgi:hypothetical protein
MKRCLTVTSYLNSCLIKLFSKNKLMRRFKNYFENDCVQYNEDGAWNIEWSDWGSDDEDWIVECARRSCLLSRVSEKKKVIDNFSNQLWSKINRKRQKTTTRLWNNVFGGEKKTILSIFFNPNLYRFLNLKFDKIEWEPKNNIFDI